MSNQQTKTPELPPDPPSTRLIAAMGSVGLLAGILIVMTFQITQPYIKRNKAELLERAIFEVVPEAASKKVFTLDSEGNVIPLEGEDEKAFKIYACYREDGSLAGVALEASGQGFQDVVRILYGYSPEKQAIIGMKVLESTETPGLGDKIEKDPVFISNFDSLVVTLNEDQSRLVHEIVMVKHGQKSQPWEISAITGATISSRAITNMLRESTQKNIPMVMKNLPKLKEAD